jgi:hypothetical protein
MEQELRRAAAADALPAADPEAPGTRRRSLRDMLGQLGW